MTEKEKYLVDFILQNHLVSTDDLNFCITRYDILQQNNQYMPLEEILLQRNLLTPQQLQFIDRNYQQTKYDDVTCGDHSNKPFNNFYEEHATIHNSPSVAQASVHTNSYLQAYKQNPSQAQKNIPDSMYGENQKNRSPYVQSKSQVVAMQQVMPLGRYQVIEELGRGAMGIVYKAFDTMLKRYVAIKILLQQDTNSPILFQRFLLEAQASAKLNHQNIVALYDIAQLDENQFYLVMEYIEGPSLSEIIQTRAPLSLPEAVEIIWQVTLALQEAHNHNIIHRDIKPGNILITKNNIVKVTDFGLAKILSETSIANLSASGQFLGTPHYVAPEQIDGKNLDARADLYALGVTFYQILTNHYPFDSKDIYSLIFSRLKNPPTPLETYRKDLPPTLETILCKLLQPDPENRYNNATELLDALNEIIQKEESIFLHNEQSRIITFIPKPQKEKKKNHILEIICILLFTICGAILGYFKPIDWITAVQTTRKINTWLENRLEIEHGLSRLFLSDLGLKKHKKSLRDSNQNEKISSEKETTLTPYQETTQEQTPAQKQETTQEQTPTQKQETTQEQTPTQKQETTQEQTPTQKQETTQEQTPTQKQETTQEQTPTQKQETTQEQTPTQNSIFPPHVKKQQEENTEYAQQTTSKSEQTQEITSTKPIKPELQAIPMKMFYFALKGPILPKRLVFLDEKDKILDSSDKNIQIKWNKKRKHYDCIAKIPKNIEKITIFNEFLEVSIYVELQQKIKAPIEWNVLNYIAFREYCENTHKEQGLENTLILLIQCTELLLQEESTRNLVAKNNIFKNNIIQIFYNQILPEEWNLRKQKILDQIQNLKKI